MYGKSDQNNVPDFSAFLDEHGILMADKLKEYEETLNEDENIKHEK